jgi:hypothetical protein
VAGGGQRPGVHAARTPPGPPQGGLIGDSGRGSAALGGPPLNGLHDHGLPRSGHPANALHSNGLPANGLPVNDVPANCLPANGLSPTGLSPNGTLMPYLQQRQPSGLDNGWPAHHRGTGQAQSAAYGPGAPDPSASPPAAAGPPVPQAGLFSVTDAVRAAHAEGYGFGDSVARDAPALWLEAVLARKPRMPSDLEARLLQGSSLPIDSLLHDEVRHALRRGFWDGLERSRR